ncbi:hypothetical protein [Kitasatospora sp. NPDC127116]|uniref:hypothetical protein n=1 Tax=Kitasatospora sp. NPDC127116 TaxID=3345367 RepID=UPI00363A3F8D
MTDHLRVSSGRFVVDGTHGSTYNANDLNTIDANLEDISKRGPDHPDIDRLLDARRIVGPWQALFGTTEPTA